MNTKLTKSAAEAVATITGQFTTREIPGLVNWLKKLWEENPPAVLAVNPPNHSYDVEDGTHDLSLGEKAVKQKRQHHQDLSGSIFEYRIVFDGSFRILLGALKGMSEEVQQEAAMAFFLEYRQGNYLCNTPEWREVARILENKSDNLDNPFYKGVCVAILEMFRAEGCMD